jgi:hypothetical protein
MTSTPSTHQRGDDQLALLNQLRERALASVDDPNSTLAIFEWSAEDGCAVDDWDAVTEGSASVTRSRTKRSCPRW